MNRVIVGLVLIATDVVAHILRIDNLRRVERTSELPWRGAAAEAQGAARPAEHRQAHQGLWQRPTALPSHAWSDFALSSLYPTSSIFVPGDSAGTSGRKHRVNCFRSGYLPPDRPITYRHSTRNIFLAHTLYPGLFDVYIPRRGPALSGPISYVINIRQFRRLSSLPGD